MAQLASESREHAAKVEKAKESVIRAARPIALESDSLVGACGPGARLSRALRRLDALRGTR
jgi:hypothetical protein